MRSFIFTLLAYMVFTPLAANARPVVAELFTSQGCPSCPAADEVMKQLAADSGILPLSFHVTYFDNEGWKDPYATSANTQRQQNYVKTLGLDSMFTPQMVIDGTVSVVGSDRKAISDSLAFAHQSQEEYPMSITLNNDTNGLDVVIGDGSAPPTGATLYEVHFNRRTVTPVSAGQNNGITMDNTNNVVAFFPIAYSPQYFVPLSGFSQDGIAYLLQNRNGKILGAAYYLRN